MSRPIQPAPSDMHDDGERTRWRLTADGRTRLVIVLVSFALMAVLRDVRPPVDGCGFGLDVRRLAAGEFEDVFRWTHPLLVPVLLAGHRLVSVVASVEFMVIFQGLDIVLGAVSLGLLHALLRRLGVPPSAALASILLVLVSWVFWLEAVTGDEKMPGFTLILVVLLLLERSLGASAPENRSRSVPAALALGGILGLALLLHVAAVLVVPAAAFLVVRRRAWRFGLAAAAAAGFLVLATYAVILRLLAAEGLGDVAAYFSSGVSRYSIAATGLSGLAWARHVVQGYTKLHWAVFTEDGLRVALVLAGLSGVLLIGVLWTMWRSRPRRGLDWLLVLFATALLHGLTYAPEVPDSYMLLLVPTAVYFGLWLADGRWRVVAATVLVVLTIFNGAHYWRFSTFGDNGADRRYQAAIARTLRGGDHLVTLDEEMAFAAGTQTIVPVHRYLNPQLVHVPGSEFFADPADPSFRELALDGRLYIEGLCFEDFQSRGSPDIEATEEFRALSGVYTLAVAVPFTDYSTLYHRAYKNVYRLRPLERSMEASRIDD